LSKRLATVVMWTSGTLRCVLVTTGPPTTYDIQVLQDGVPVVLQECESGEAGVRLAALLWERFVVSAPS
jgi:hypothetical protein